MNSYYGWYTNIENYNPVIRDNKIINVNE